MAKVKTSLVWCITECNHFFGGPPHGLFVPARGTPSQHWRCSDLSLLPLFDRCSVLGPRKSLSHPGALRRGGDSRPLLRSAAALETISSLLCHNHRLPIDLDSPTTHRPHPAQNDASRAAAATHCWKVRAPRSTAPPAQRPPPPQWPPGPRKPHSPSRPHPPPKNRAGATHGIHHGG